MAVSRYNSKQNQPEINLATDIYCFLQNESCKEHYSKNEKHSIDVAADTIEKVYKVKSIDNVAVKQMNALKHTVGTKNYLVSIRNQEAAEYYKQKGNNYMDEEMFELAEVEYTKAIEMNPTNSVYFCNRAASRLRQGLYVDAMKDAKKALELDKTYVKAYCWLGLCYVFLNQPSKAFRYYNKALRLEPNSSICITNINLITRKRNLKVLKVLEPLYWCGQRLTCITTYLAQNYSTYRSNSSVHHDELKASNKIKNISSKIQKYKLCEID